MVDRYWRKIEDVENDIENAMQISSILLKLKGYDNNLGKIDTNTGNISSNSGQINNNSSIISSNFKQITTNAGNISTNSGQINNDTSSISTNLGKINTNTSAISTNSGQINNNTSAISTNSGQINNNTSSISTNLGKINTNTSTISTNLGQISTNENNILSNSKKINNIKEFLISPEDFKKSFNIEKQIFKFNRNTHFYTIFEKEIIHDFTKNSLLFIDNNIHYKYENLLNDYHRLQHQYDIYDNEGNLIYRYLFNKDTYYDENKNPILLTIDDFCIYFKKNYDKIKVILLLHRHNRHGLGNIDLEIDGDNDNYININYIDKNNEDIEKNKKDISSNLIKINSNEDDRLYNLSEINNIKNNSSKSYLKNVYNILFYDKKTQVSFRNYFYEKVFDVNASINDFIEMSFKISLQYENISERSYVKTLYELFDENDNSLYIKSVSNDDYSYYSNKIFIDESIFYNFNKNIKFVIKFQMILSRVIKIWYIKNDNYRLTIKNHGL